jgi:2-oxoglutarate ferredoxin oxidoreductase subunit delta
MTEKGKSSVKKARATKKQKAKKSKPTEAKTAVREEQPEVKKEKFEVEFYRDWCKGCGICVAFCPAGALSMNDKGEPEIIKEELCTGCTWCEIRCPDFAVQVKEKKEEEVCEA